MKKTWKKWVALGMTFGMMAGIVGCGRSKNLGSESTTEVATKQESATPIKIATKPMTEQFILGEMLKLVIEDSTDYSVKLTKGIGVVRIILCQLWNPVILIYIRNILLLVTLWF